MQTISRCTFSPELQWVPIKLDSDERMRHINSGKNLHELATSRSRIIPTKQSVVKGMKTKTLVHKQIFEKKWGIEGTTSNMEHFKKVWKLRGVT